MSDIRSKIRIESDGTPIQTRIYYVPDAGEEVDISDCIQAIDIRIDIGQAINTATIQAVLIGGEIRAEVEDLIVNDLRPPGTA